MMVMTMRCIYSAMGNPHQRGVRDRVRDRCGYCRDCGPVHCAQFRLRSGYRGIGPRAPAGAVALLLLQVVSTMWIPNVTLDAYAKKLQVGATELDFAEVGLLRSPIVDSASGRGSHAHGSTVLTGFEINAVNRAGWRIHLACYTTLQESQELAVEWARIMRCGVWTITAKSEEAAA